LIFISVVGAMAVNSSCDAEMEEIFKPKIEMLTTISPGTVRASCFECLTLTFGRASTARSVAHHYRYSRG